jgi:HAD superfamily hydrolase (TIGR01509 family)
MFLKSQNKKYNLKDTKAVIFDFDGTLVDTEHVWTRAKIQISKHYGRRLSEAETDPFVGLKVIDFVEAIFCDETKIIKQKIVNEIVALALKAFPDEMLPMPGAAELVHTFSNHGFKTCVCSSASTSAIHLGLQKLGIKECMSLIISGDDVTFGKPHPEPYLKTINTLGIPSKHSLAFEDSHPGLKSATSAGIPTIVVNKNILDIDSTGTADVVKTMSEFSIVKN